MGTQIEMVFKDAAVEKMMDATEVIAMLGDKVYLEVDRKAWSDYWFGNEEDEDEGD